MRTRPSPSTNRSRAVPRRPDHFAGRQGRRTLRAASLLPPRFRAARQLQALHRVGQRQDGDGLHDEGGGGPGDRGRHARTQRPAPHAGADAVRRGQSFLPRLREERQLSASGARLRIRDGEPAFRAFLSRSRRRRFPPRCADRPQSLHPVRALRPGEPRRRWQGCVRARRARARGQADHQFAERPVGRQRLRRHRQGGACLPGRRNPHQARRLRRADRRARLRPRADQRRGDDLRNSGERS